MNADIKRLWIERLRSGRDQQGIGSLNRGNKLCCLGVLCEIAVEQGVFPTPLDQGGLKFYGEGTDLNCSMLPKPVQQWSGVTSHGYYGERTNADGWLHRDALTSDNDSGKTFAQIADIIEANF